jgi:hypothetical protein
MNQDGTVNIPMSVDSIYGFVYGKFQAKHFASLTARMNVAIGSEAYISALRSSALSVSPSSTFSKTYELSTTSLSNCEPSSFSMLAIPGSTTVRAVDLDMDQSFGAVRSESIPASTSDCNINFPTQTWEFRQYPFSPLSNALQHCCATACSALLATIGVSPTALMLDTCCSSCNKHNCVPANTVTIAAAALYTVIQVPALLNANITTISLNLNVP